MQTIAKHGSEQERCEARGLLVSLRNKEMSKKIESDTMKSRFNVPLGRSWALPLAGAILIILGGRRNLASKVKCRLVTADQPTRSAAAHDSSGLRTR